MRCFWKALVCANLLWVAFAAPAHASNFLWNGNINDSWGTMTNWSPSGIPGTGDTVGFQGLSSNTSIDLNGNHSVLSASFGLTTPYTLNAGGSFTLTLESGNLATTGSATHTINSDGGTTGTIPGNVVNNRWLSSCAESTSRNGSRSHLFAGNLIEPGEETP